MRHKAHSPSDVRSFASTAKKKMTCQIFRHHYNTRPLQIGIVCNSAEEPMAQWIR